MGLYSTIYIALKIPMEEKNIEEIKTKYQSKQCCKFHDKKYLYLYLYTQNDNSFGGLLIKPFKEAKDIVKTTLKEMTDFFQKEYPIVYVRESFISEQFTHNYKELDFTKEFNKYLQ